MQTIPAEVLGVRAFRKQNPRSRVNHLDSKYSNNGPTKKRTVCACCNQATGSWCGKYPKTLRAVMEEIRHARGCNVRAHFLAEGYNQFAEELRADGCIFPDAAARAVLE